MNYLILVDRLKNQVQMNLKMAMFEKSSKFELEPLDDDKPLLYTIYSS